MPPRALGKTSIENLSAAARERGLPLLAMSRRASSIAGLKEKAGRAFENFAGLIDDLAALRELPAEEVIRQLLVETRYREHLAAEAGTGGEDRLANLDELITAAREFDQSHPGASIQDFLAEITLASAIDRWDQDTGAVTLMTLHAAKGLEFPVVFIVALEEGLLPHSRANENINELEEERRLLFVGITRARRELYLSRCCVRSFRGQQQATLRSRFLDELPEEEMVLNDLSGYGYYETRPRSGGRSWPPTRPEPTRPAATTQFRLTTAAALEEARGAVSPPIGGGTVDLESFKPGISVLHPEYGLGRIVAIDGAGPNRKGRVAFVGGPERSFILAKSPLRPVVRTAQDGQTPRRIGDGRS